MEMSNDTMGGINKEMRDINDKLDSLHNRMDRFYAWSALLQKEFRDIQQRQKFIESQCSFEFSSTSTETLQKRLDEVRKKT